MNRIGSTNTKELIINAAEGLISTSGINSFTLRDIAHHCPISLGTLYYYFKSKDEIILEIMQKHLSYLNDEYFSWLNRHKEDLEPERFLDVILYKGVKLYDRAKIHLFLLNECMGNKKLLEKYKTLYQEWKKNIVIGTKQVFKNVKDAEAFSQLILLIIDGLIVQEVLENNDENKTEKIKNIIKGLANE